MPHLQASRGNRRLDNRNPVKTGSVISRPFCSSSVDTRGIHTLPSAPAPASASASASVGVHPLSDEDLTFQSGSVSHRSHPNPTHIPTSSRLDRLLQQRQINRINRTLGPHAHSEVGHGGQTIDRSSVSGARVGVDDSLCPPIAPPRQRLLVVANRLPVSATRHGDEWSLELSAGGLVSALLGVRQFETKWIGWAGVNVSDEVGQVALKKALEEKMRKQYISTTMVIVIMCSGHFSIIWDYLKKTGFQQLAAWKISSRHTKGPTENLLRWCILSTKRVM